MSEASAWATLRKSIAEYTQDIQRFEDVLSRGIPDTNFCYKGKEIWLEGKYVKALPKRNTTPLKVGLRPEQEAWLSRRSKSGGSCFVWVRINCPGSSINGWYLSQDFAALREGFPLSEMTFHMQYFKTAGELTSRLIELA